MPTLLHIDVSPRGSFSISKQLSAAAVAAWKAKHPTGKVIERDLSKTELSFVDVHWIMGAYTPPEKHSEEHKRALALSDELVGELQAADEIVIGTPMYNFGVPAALKAWIDHVERFGETFAYGAKGLPEGLLKGKKLIVTIASGGRYAAGTQLEYLDHELPYLRMIFGYIGITDVTFVQAGGTARVMKQEISAQEFLAPFVSQAQAAV